MTKTEKIGTQQTYIKGTFRKKEGEKEGVDKGMNKISEICNNKKI